MSKDKKLPEGFTCECGKFHEFSAWVFAHWDDTIWNRCECGRLNTLIAGQIIRSEKDPL